MGLRIALGPEDRAPAVQAEPAFQLKYENEDLLSCPIMPDSPEAWPPPAAWIPR